MVGAGLGAVVAVGVALGVDVGVALGVAVGVALGVAAGVAATPSRAITNNNTLGTRCSVDVRGRRTRSTATSKVCFSAEVRESVGMWFKDLKAAERSGSSS